MVKVMDGIGIMGGGEIYAEAKKGVEMSRFK